MSDDEKINLAEWKVVGEDMTVSLEKIQGSPAVKKSSRRSPTTGHRRRKHDVKRSHSSPRDRDGGSSEEEDESLKRSRSMQDKPEPPKKTLRKKSKAKGDKAEEPVSLKEEKTEQKEVETEKIFEADESPSDEAAENSGKETSPPPPAESWWWKWMPFWSRKASNETNIEENETTALLEDEEDDLSSEFATLVTQTESKLIAELESQIIPEAQTEKEITVQPLELELPPPTFSSWSQFLQDIRVKFKNFRAEFPREVETLKKLRNRCASEMFIILIFCGLGALVFKFVEGAFESFYKCGVKRVKRDFIDELWRSSHNLREDEWKSKARRKLMEFENQLQEAFEAGMTTYSGRKSWSFINSIIYCLTVVTTIGAVLYYI